MTSNASGETQLDALQTVVQRLSRADSEQEICDAVIDAVSSVFGVEFGGLWLYDDDDGILRLAVTNDESLSEQEAIEQSGSGLLWDVFEGDAIDPETDIESATAGSALESELVLPVGESGVLRIGSFDDSSFTSQDRRVAGILATNVEAALDRRDREHELQVKNDRLEEFVGIISHDLRNPLSVVDGNIQLALADYDDDRLRQASSAVDRMENLIDELMTLADQGFVVTDRQQLELASLAETAWSTVHAPSATLHTAGNATLYGDRSQLLQLFENLFRNAIEHAGEDVEVRVGPLEPLSTTTRASGSGGPRGFYIEDDGPGIPESAYDDVFEFGYSSESTGLGLSIVYRIVVAHGWEIACKDPVRSGARFEITDGVKAINPFVAQ